MIFKQNLKSGWIYLLCAQNSAVICLALLWKTKKNYHFIQCVYVDFFSLCCERETDIRINITMIFKQNLELGLNLLGIHIYSFAQIVCEKKQGRGIPTGTLEEFSSLRQKSDRKSWKIRNMKWSSFFQAWNRADSNLFIYIFFGLFFNKI